MDVKKMLAVGAAVVGTVAMADIISSSVVGYTVKEAAQGKFLIIEQFHLRQLFINEFKIER